MSSGEQCGAAAASVVERHRTGRVGNIAGRRGVSDMA